MKKEFINPDGSINYKKIKEADERLWGTKYPTSNYKRKRIEEAEKRGRELRKNIKTVGGITPQERKNLKKKYKEMKINKEFPGKSKFQQFVEELKKKK